MNTYDERIQILLKDLGDLIDAVARKEIRGDYDHDTPSGLAYWTDAAGPPSCASGSLRGLSRDQVACDCVGLCAFYDIEIPED